MLFRLTYLQVLFLFGISCAVQAQTKDPYLTSEEVFKKDGYNPLTPARAAFYSAILPGLGQTYNKDYWKVPIVYGALAIPIYYYATNNTTYKNIETKQGYFFADICSLVCLASIRSKCQRSFVTVQRQ